MSTNNELNIRGNLLRHLPVEILVEVLQTKLKGSLRLTNKEQKAIIYIESGKVVFAVSNMREHRLFQILLDEKQIQKQELVKFESFTNDLYLAKNLVDKNHFTQEDINKFLQFQTTRIIKTVLDWQTGDWIYSPFARVQKSLKFPLDLNPLLQNFAGNIDKQKVLERFKTLAEVFYLNNSNSEDNFGGINISSEEAFVLSRIGNRKLEIKDILSLSGLPNNDLLFVLYKLWISGILCRTNWNTPFDKSFLKKLDSADFSLKISATSIEEVETDIKIQEEKAEEEAREAEKTAAEQVQKEKQILEEYLTQIETATSHYQLFEIGHEADVKEIKDKYFSIAKRFHPDIFHKKVDAQLHRRIQSAFTEVAEAYDTLKDDNSREIYNFRLRKAIEALKQKSNDTPDEEINDAKDDSVLASESFNTGYNFLMENRFDQSVSYLARAVQLESGNARYHAYYGKALSKNKDQHRQAASELKEAITLDAGNSIYRLMLAEIYAEVGLLTSAKGELKRLLEFDPQNTEAISLLNELGNK